MAREIDGLLFEEIDAKETIFLQDSFVLNKIGVGNGEARLYIGQGNNQETLEFWDYFQRETENCFLLKEDLVDYLNKAYSEFIQPSRPYQNRGELRQIYDELFETVQQSQTILPFQVCRSNVDQVRIYINSSVPRDVNYNLIRKMGFDDYSYLSILKLRKMDDGGIFYYFKLSFDYSHGTEPSYNYYDDLIENQIVNDTNIETTDKTAIIKARRGQGSFRERLINECCYCPFTLVDDPRLLIASHIKPWGCQDTTNFERLDHKNGFLFTPTYDKLFDRGLISFTDDGRLMISPWLSVANQQRLRIYDGMFMEHLPLDNMRRFYLQYHRINVFKK